MIAIREYIQVKNHQLIIDLPKDFNYSEVEVVIMPKKEGIVEMWKEDELRDIGKIGLESKSFEDDDEDYSKW